MDKFWYVMNEIMSMILLIMAIVFLVNRAYTEATFYIAFSYGLKFTNRFDDVLEAINKKRK